MYRFVMPNILVVKSKTKVGLRMSEAEDILLLTGGTGPSF
jgi:hypothetical protein